MHRVNSGVPDVLGAYLNKVMKLENDSLHVKVLCRSNFPLQETNRMKKPDWDRIQEIYHVARKLPRSEQRAFVETVCDGDIALAGEVMELLAADDASFLDTPVLNLPLTSSENNLVETTIADRYYIERELGPGGMSQVYLARDRRLDNRAVVIKFLSRELLENSYARQKF